jgi:MFS family permease
VILATAGVGLLSFGLVKGPEWGWALGRVGSVLGAGVVFLLVFVWHCRHARAPLVQPELFRSREFTVASIIAVFFSAAFGAMLLSIVLWEQGAWGWSALRAGLAIAPGPIMVPVMSFLAAGRLIRRYGAAAVIIAGSVAFAAGRVWWALAITQQSNYLTGVLGGMILGGVGVGLVLPTMMGTATASLPAHAFATGSGAINMIRQTGLALGVALLVAVLGTGSGHHTAGLAAFDQGWWLTAALALAGAVPALALLHRLRPAITAPGARAESGGRQSAPQDALREVDSG